MLPTIAIAPVQKRIEALTKPLAISAATLSLLATLLPTQRLKRRISSSISILSPIIAPITRLKIVITILVVLRAICTPIMTIQKAIACIIVSCHLCGKPFLSITPQRAPATIAPLLAIVPKPNIIFSLNFNY